MPVEVLLEQGSKDWLEFRQDKRMASETPAVLGVSPYQRQSDIRRIKNGGAGQFVNSAMRQGVQQEPLAREAYINDYEMVRPAVFVDGDYGASLDGINMDMDIIWECKTPVDGVDSERWKLATNNQLTEYDYAQVQHQLMVTGAKKCHFCVWDVQSQSYMLAEVYPELEYFEKIKAGWNAFWETLGLRTDRAWTKAVKEYKQAKSQVDYAETILEQAKANLLDLLQGDSNEGAGVRVQRITVKGRTDWKRVEKELLVDADLTSYKTPDSVQIRINEIKE